MVGLSLKKVGCGVGNTSVGLSGSGVGSVAEIKKDCSLRGPRHGNRLDFFFTCADLPS